VAGKSAAQKANNASRSQSRAIKFSWQEDFRTMRQQELTTLGQQSSRYAASGVDVGVGSAATVMQETKDQFHRAVAADAYLTQQRLKGASLENKAVQYQQVGNYFSNAAELAGSIYSGGKAAGWWGQ
jgi:hypothetical protein